jgi:ferredoxin
MITVTFITNDNKVATAPDNSNLLRVSLREKGGIPFKCGGGLCGTCKCLIESGLENTDAIKDKEKRHLTEADFAAGHRMACQTFIVKGAVSVSWQPKPKPAAAAVSPVEVVPPT